MKMNSKNYRLIYKQRMFGIGTIFYIVVCSVAGAGISGLCDNDIRLTREDERLYREDEQLCREEDETDPKPETATKKKRKKKWIPRSKRSDAKTDAYTCNQVNI
jgi:hypothetical protein